MKDDSQLSLSGWNEVAASGVAVRIVDRFGLQVSGPDAERYLNGQVTNDVRRATEERAIYAAITNAKGQMEGDAWIRRGSEGSFLLDAPLSLEGTLPGRLERYAIADDVSFERVEAPAWHIFGGSAAAEAGVGRFGMPGYDCENQSAGLSEMTALEAERIRVLMGLPRWDADLVSGMLLPDAGIDPIAVSYDKGCYIGQEVISRIRRAGKTNKKLTYLVAKHSVESVVEENLAGEELFSDEGIAVGTITSAAWHPRLDRWAAIAYVKKAAFDRATAGFFLEASPREEHLFFTEDPAPYKAKSADV